MVDDMQEKIQQIELETVKSITELKADVKNLTSIIGKLENTISTLTMNFVRTDIYSMDKRDRDEEHKRIWEAIAKARKSGTAKAIVWSILTALFTSVVIYELSERLLK